MPWKNEKLFLLPPSTLQQIQEIENWIKNPWQWRNNRARKIAPHWFRFHDTKVFASLYMTFQLRKRESERKIKKFYFIFPPATVTWKFSPRVRNYRTQPHKASAITANTQNKSQKIFSNKNDTFITEQKREEKSFWCVFILKPLSAFQAWWDVLGNFLVYVSLSSQNMFCVFPTVFTTRSPPPDAFCCFSPSL